MAAKNSAGQARQKVDASPVEAQADDGNTESAHMRLTGAALRFTCL
jgi:hypothetical protein